MDLVRAWKELCEASTLPAIEPFASEWVSIGHGYPRKVLGHWDSPQIIREIAFFDLQRAKDLLRLYLTHSFRKEDGMMAIWVLASSDKNYSPSTKGASFLCSHPPIWSHCARIILASEWDESLALLSLQTGIANLAWWNANRRDPLGLYWYRDSYPDEDKCWESGYDASPRWDHTELGPFPCIDLNCQILMLLEDLSFIAEKLNDTETVKKMKKEYLQLKKRIGRYFWDELYGCFTDYDLAGANAKKTCGLFWSLVSGAAEESDIERMEELLKGEEGFSTKYGITTVALSEKSFTLDCWKGPMWFSQIYWLCIGLQRYQRKNLARSIAQRSLFTATKILHETGVLWEFYNPLEGSVSNLLRKGSPTGPFPNYLGHNPLISLTRIADGEDLWRKE
jgi:hypothetical protein